MSKSLTLPSPKLEVIARNLSDLERGTSLHAELQCIFHLYRMAKRHRGHYCVVIVTNEHQLDRLRAFHESMRKFHPRDFNEYVLPSQDTEKLTPDPSKNLVWIVERDIAMTALRFNHERFIILHTPEVKGYYYS